jgi:hypothetical protein
MGTSRIPRSITIADAARLHFARFEVQCICGRFNMAPSHASLTAVATASPTSPEPVTRSGSQKRSGRLVGVIRTPHLLLT